LTRFEDIYTHIIYLRTADGSHSLLRFR